MLDDIAIDDAFRTLGLDWRATVEEVLSAGRARGAQDAPKGSALWLARHRALSFALALRQDQERDRAARGTRLWIEGAAGVDDEPEGAEDVLLVDDPNVDPPEAWESAPTVSPAAAAPRSGVVSLAPFGLLFVGAAVVTAGLLQLVQ